MHKCSSVYNERGSLLLKLSCVDNGLVRVYVGPELARQVKLILSPKQRAKLAASRTRTCTNEEVCIASGECPSRFRHRAENESVSGHAKMPPASHQVSATSLKLLIQQIHPHVRVERDSGMCLARDLYELWGRSPYNRMFVARTSPFMKRVKASQIPEEAVRA